MLKASIIEPTEEYEWVSPMIIQPKKTYKICIYVDLTKLNNVCVHDPFPTFFTDEVLENGNG